MLTQTGMLLAPCQVRTVEHATIVALPDGREVRALSALPYRYHAQQGDSLLCAFTDDVCYIIGVIDGHGSIELVSRRDLLVSAPQGRIELHARQVDAKADAISLHSRRLDMLAHKITERCVRAVRWVREALRLKAGRLRYQVDDELALRAGRMTARAQQDARIDGEKIMLG